MKWIGLIVHVAWYWTLLAFFRFAFSFLPKSKPRRHASQTIYPVTWLTKTYLVGLSGVLLAITTYLALSRPPWALLPLGLAAVLLLAIPGEILVDSQGIRRSRYFLLPGGVRELPWQEIDSLYEDVTSTQYGSLYSVIVSAGPESTIEFSSMHAGLEEFIAEVQEHGVPVSRLRSEPDGDSEPPPPLQAAR